MNEESTVANPDTAITVESPDDNISLDDFKANVSGTSAVAEPEVETQKPEKHRSKKQQARSTDVPRIAELTRRLRATEAERDALRTPATPAPAPVIAASPVVPVAAAPTVPAPVARAAAPLPPVAAATDDPEPDATKFDDVTKYWTAVARWGAREELRAAHAAQEQAERARTQAAESTRLQTQWTAGITAAKAQYPDFEAVAYAPTQIPKGSLIDAWIREHKTGPLVLYSLQKHPTELHAMLAMPLLEQVEALTLLSQRLSGPRTAAVVTGAAPAHVSQQPVSRPPTPVRTGPMRDSDVPPDPETVDLSAFRRYHGTPNSRRPR